MYVDGMDLCLCIDLHREIVNTLCTSLLNYLLEQQIFVDSTAMHIAADTMKQRKFVLFNDASRAH